MDRKERVPTEGQNALLVAVQAALDGFQSKVWTALPVFVQSYNAEKITVECQPTIQAQVRQPDGTWVDTTLPLCVDCPVMFPGGGGFVLTFPINAQDEGLLVFASRCVDAWWQNGGVQKQAELRMHDLSDGFFIPTGGMSNPNVPPNVSTTSAQLRSKDGTVVVDLNATDKQVKVTAPGGIIFDGPVAFLNTVSGAEGGGGTINFANAEIMSNGKNIDSTHTHDDVQSGGDVSGPVT